ncbi:MAG: 50S ribosomal protein bL37 [Planctomycetota bacterium]
MGKNSRRPKKANHGKRPASHHGRWKKRVKTPR